MLNIELVKKYLSYNDWRAIDNGDDEEEDYRWDDDDGDGTLRRTCSMLEIGTNTDESTLAYELAKTVANGNVKAIICNLTAKDWGKMYEKFGFQSTFTYMGNHEKQVTTYLLDLNGVTFDLLRPTPPLPKVRKQGQLRGLV